MKIIGLEEHFLTEELMQAWANVDPAFRDDNLGTSGPDELLDKLKDVGALRLQLMDDCGVDVQVLSLTPPGVQGLDPELSIELAHKTNDVIASTIRPHPDRFQGFAALPTPAPAEAVKELKRCVNTLGFKGAMLHGRSRDRNLDHADFDPILAAAAELGVPLYIHPQVPQRAVRDVYYSGFGEKIDYAFAAFGLGWHYEAGIQFLRLILAGTFDKYPDLQIILGHWGEVVLFYHERIGALSRVATHLQRPVADYFTNNLYVTPGGILSANYLRQSIDILGIDRILFASDYPYQLALNGGARRFLEEADLSQEEKEKIAHGNWERLTSQI